MTDKVVWLNGEKATFNGQPDARVVELLEQALADAKAGLLRGIAGAFDYQAGARCITIGAVNVFEVLGAMDLARWRMCETMER